MTTPSNQLSSYELHHPSTPQQYPSQLGDYIPLDASYAGQKKSYSSKSNFQRNANNRMNQNYYQKQQKVFNRNDEQNGNKNRSRSETAKNINHEADDSYFHISMLEDPWKPLIQRLNAIKNSETSLNKSDK